MQAAKEFEAEISKAREPGTENQSAVIEESPEEEVITSHCHAENIRK
jgi:hypothetical protein